MSFGLQSSKKRGSLLIGLLIAMTAALAFMASMYSTFKLSIIRSSEMLDQRIAIDRAQSAAALLKAPVFYCGYGMPSEASSYREAFLLQTQREPFNWSGPVSVMDRNGRRNAELRIAYGMPSRVSVNYSCAKSGAAACISLKQPFEKNYELVRPFYFSKPNNVKNWLLFGAMLPPASPFAVKSVAGMTVRVQGRTSEFMIPEGDEAYLFRALKVYCDKGALYTQNYRSSGVQPRTQGIEDMRFELAGDKKTLTIYIIARGNLAADGNALRDADDWPEEYKTAAAASRYRLYASKITWSLPNCVGKDLSLVKNIAAQF